MSGLGKRYVVVVERMGASHLLADSYEHALHAWDKHTVERVLEIDLDAALIVPATDEQRAMHAEAQELYFAGERERLWPALQGQKVKAAEQGEPIADTKWQVRANQLRDALPSAARTSLGAMSQVLSWMLADDWEALGRFCMAMGDVHRSMLGQPMPCSTCGGVDSVCNCDCGGNYCGCPCHTAVPRQASSRARLRHR